MDFGSVGFIKEFRSYEMIDWIDGECDVYDIPPSILFMGMMNTYSHGVRLYIPFDMEFPKFCEYCAMELSNKNNDFPFHRAKEFIDLEYLHKTGVIKSVRQWNYEMDIRNKIRLDSGNVMGSLQSIVASCRIFMREKFGK